MAFFTTSRPLFVNQLSDDISDFLIAAAIFHHLKKTSQSEFLMSASLVPLLFPFSGCNFQLCSPQNLLLSFPESLSSTPLQQKRALHNSKRGEKCLKWSRERQGLKSTTQIDTQIWPQLGEKAHGKNSDRSGKKSGFVGKTPRFFGSISPDIRSLLKLADGYQVVFGLLHYSSLPCPSLGWPWTGQENCCWISVGLAGKERARKQNAWA